MWQNLSTFPWAECWVDSKASRVKCTTASPLTPFHLLGCSRGRFRKRNLKHAKECSIQQRRGFACGVCRWKRRFGCSRNSAVSAARFESGFRERDGQGQHWRGPHSHGGFLKMIVCESGGHANGLTYFIFRFLRRPLAKLSEADGEGNLSRLAKQPRSGLAFTGWRRTNDLWLGCRG